MPQSFELRHVATILEFKMKRIIIYCLRLKFRSFVTTIHGWPTQPTIKEIKNLITDQEVNEKQMSGATVENNKKSLFTDKKRHYFKHYSGGGFKGDVNNLRGYQQKSSSQIGGAQKNRGSGGQYKSNKKFEGNCYNCEKKKKKEPYIERLQV